MGLKTLPKQSSTACREMNRRQTSRADPLTYAQEADTDTKEFLQRKDILKRVVLENGKCMCEWLNSDTVKLFPF